MKKWWNGPESKEQVDPEASVRPARHPCPSIHSHPPQAGNPIAAWRLAPGTSMAANPKRMVSEGLRFRKEHWVESKPSAETRSAPPRPPQRCGY